MALLRDERRGPLSVGVLRKHTSLLWRLRGAAIEEERASARLARPSGANLKRAGAAGMASRRDHTVAAAATSSMDKMGNCIGNKLMQNWALLTRAGAQT